VKLARELSGEHAVLALSLPGFGREEELPGSAAAAVAALAEAVRELELGPGLLLGGHSSGGWLAQAVATHLEGIGEPVAAVLLLDSYPPQSPLLAQMLPLMLAAAADPSGAEAAIDDARLLAVGGYRRIFAGWSPAAVEAATLLIQAGEPAWEADPDSWQASWELPHSAAVAAGNHFTMMTDHASSTAAAIEDLLDRESANRKVEV
jgi:thioesterase domain-containing protein